MKFRFCAALLLAGAASTAMAGEVVKVLAAGSLRLAFAELAQAFESQGLGRVQLVFAASGLLKDRIVAGEAADVFASANLDHPQALVEAGKASRVQPFARNTLCVLAQPGFSLQGRDLVSRLLDPTLRIGTSTPGADPAGDYAWRMFELIESTGAAGAGSAAQLKSRARQLTGGPQSPAAPADRSIYGLLMSEDRADVFVTYCTNAAQARREWPALQVLQIPPGVNVSATYGLVVVEPAAAPAQAFAAFVAGANGQAILARHGFASP
jgi:ABC-type molybdate transport system substrate-binding protein